MTRFPFSMETPARFAGPLPARCDTVVIGGGIAGVMTAFFGRGRAKRGSVRKGPDRR